MATTIQRRQQGSASTLLNLALQAPLPLDDTSHIMTHEASHAREPTSSFLPPVENWPWVLFDQDVVTPWQAALQRNNNLFQEQTMVQPHMGPLVNEACTISEIDHNVIRLDWFSFVELVKVETADQINLKVTRELYVNDGTFGDGKLDFGFQTEDGKRVFTFLEVKRPKLSEYYPTLPGIHPSPSHTASPQNSETNRLRIADQLAKYLGQNETKYGMITDYYDWIFFSATMVRSALMLETHTVSWDQVGNSSVRNCFYGFLLFAICQQQRSDLPVKGLRVYVEDAQKERQNQLDQEKAKLKERQKQEWNDRYANRGKGPSDDDSLQKPHSYGSASDPLSVVVNGLLARRDEGLFDFLATLQLPGDCPGLEERTVSVMDLRRIGRLEKIVDVAVGCERWSHLVKVFIPPFTTTSLAYKSYRPLFFPQDDMEELRRQISPRSLALEFCHNEIEAYSGLVELQAMGRIPVFYSPTQDTIDFIPGILTEFVEGLTLREWKQRASGQKKDEGVTEEGSGSNLQATTGTFEFKKQLAKNEATKTLNLMHDKGWIHGDVDERNILIIELDENGKKREMEMGATWEGHVKVVFIDFAGTRISDDEKMRERDWKKLESAFT